MTMASGELAEAAPVGIEMNAEAPDKDQAVNDTKSDADQGAKDDSPGGDDGPSKEEMDRQLRERKATIQAVQLELMGDLPFAEVKPPENVLFVCKLNPVTQDEDLELIFGRFGKIISCEIIRDAKTGDSLQYAFIEFDDKSSCETAYFKMQDVLIDDRRIHVDFSQSVSKLSDAWRKGTNKKRRANASRGGWGGVEELEKKRQYRAQRDRSEGEGYDMVHGEDKARARHEHGDVDAGREERASRGYRHDDDERGKARNRSRSPRRRDAYRDRHSSGWRDDRRRDRHSDARDRAQGYSQRERDRYRDESWHRPRQADSYHR